MDHLNIPREGGVVTFGQLYGMHDHITLTLGEQKSVIPFMHTNMMCTSLLLLSYVCMYFLCPISSLTGRAGYEAYKYLPYGPVVEVLPYLCRRANENSSMVKGAIEYRKFLGRELMSRLRKATKVF